MKSKTMWKRIAATFLTGCMIMGSLTGCGDTNTETQATGSATSETQGTVASSEVEEVKEPVELTYYGKILAASSTLTTLNEMEIMKVADEKCNTKVTYVHPASGTEKEDFNLKLTSMQFEDIVEYSWGSYGGGPTQALEDGVIIDLAPYIEAGYAPNFKKILEENPEIAKQITTDDGRIYAFPAIGDPSVNVSQGFYFRGDMLEAVGKEAPETIAEWEEVLTAFKNDLGIEAPFTGTSVHLIGGNSYLAGAFGTYSGYYVKDGKVQYGFITEEYKEYIQTMVRWYENGLIDQNIFGNDSKATQTQLLNDKSAVAYGAIGSAIGTFTNNAKANENTNPDFKLVAVQYPVVNKGDEPVFINRSWDARTANQAAISGSCKNVEAAVAYLDFWYSEEGNLLKNFGVEGVSYEMVNGAPVYTDEIMKNPDGLSIAQALGKYTRASQPTVGKIDVRYYEQYYELQEQIDAMKLWNAYSDNAVSVLMPPTTQTAEEAEELAILESAIKTYVEEEVTKFVMGTRDMSEWDAFVETVKGMDVERAIEIKQAAYNRYMAR